MRVSDEMSNLVIFLQMEAEMQPKCYFVLHVMCP